MNQFRGADWGEALGSGILKGIAIGNQVRASKAQYDYSNAADAAKEQYDADMKAAGDDQQAQMAAAAKRDASMSMARQNYHTYLGDVDKAEAAYRDAQDADYGAKYISAGEQDPYGVPSAGKNAPQKAITMISNGEVQFLPQHQQGSAPKAQYDAKGAAAYLSELQAGFKKDPTAVNNALIEKINADPLRRAQGVSFGLSGQGQFQMFQNGKPAGSPQPIPGDLYNGMVNGYFDDEVASRFGKNPNLASSAAGGVGALGPTAPSGEVAGGEPQTQAGRPQAMITGGNVPQAAGTLLNKPRTRQNETVTTTRKIQSAQGQRVPNDGRPTAMQDIVALKRLAQQTRLPVKQSELLNYMEANERKVDQYYNAYFRRFHRWPSGAERGRLLQIAQAKEALRHNQEIENRLAMNTAEAIRKDAYAEEAARVAAMQKSSDTVKSEDKPEKFTLGEPNEEGAREVIGGNGLLTGYSAMIRPTDGRRNPVVYVPNGLPRKKVSQVIDFMSEHGFGNPINTSNGTTEWIQGQTKDGNLRTISFLEAMRMAEEGAAKVKAEEAARTAAADAKVKADRKAKLARYKKDYALYKKDPQALAREVEERKKAMDK